ncbi:unnamed protein product, partial [Cercopithifilaria johnstoni]
MQCQLRYKVDVSTANAGKNSHLQRISNGVTVPVVQDNSIKQHQPV